MNKRKVIIDTDPGVDDALAIIYALKHPEIEVLGITTVGGNKGLETTSLNATRVLNRFDNILKPIVFKGKNRPYAEEIDKLFNRNIDYDKEVIHGTEGLGQADLISNEKLISDKDAVSFILETVKQYPDEVDIIALGPLTNIAYCIEQDESTMKKVKSIHSMGGGIHRGNRTPVAEFNYWFDPHAVNKVFSIGEDVPIHMVGLDLTHQAIFDWNDLAFIRLNGGETGSIIYSMLTDYAEFYWGQHRILGCLMHDLTAMVGYAQPDIYTEIAQANMQCVIDEGPASGQTIVDLENRWGHAENAYIPLELDVNAYMQSIFEVFFDEEVAKEYKTLTSTTENN